MSRLMCEIVFQLLICDGGTIYSEYFWVDVWYRYSAIDSRGYSVPGTVLHWHMVSMVWNGDQRLIYNSVQCTRYMSGLACGEYGIEWWPVIDSQFGTVYPVTWSVRHVVIMVRNGIQRLFRGGVQCTRYSSMFTRGEYGHRMLWWQAIDSQLGTGTRYMSGLTCGELDAHDRVWYSGYWSIHTSVLLVVRISYSSGI